MFASVIICLVFLVLFTVSFYHALKSNDYEEQPHYTVMQLLFIGFGISFIVMYVIFFFNYPWTTVIVTILAVLAAFRLLLWFCREKLKTPSAENDGYPDGNATQNSK